MVLKKLCAVRVVRVPVAYDGVLDVRRIETKLLQPARDLVFNRVVVDRVDDDDAGRCRNGPYGVFRLPQPIEVVEDLDRLGVPYGSVGRALSLPSTSSALAAWRRLASRRGRRRAQRVEEAFVIRPGSRFCCRDMRLWRVIRILRNQDRSAERDLTPWSSPRRRGPITPVLICERDASKHH